MYREEFYKNKITDYYNTYKSVVLLSILAVLQKNIEVAKNLYDNLAEIYTSFLEFIQTYGDNSIYENIKNKNYNNLPDWCESVQHIESYQKVLSLKYANIESENIVDKIIFNKMSIELNPEEEIPYLNIAKILYERGNYAEAIRLCEYIKSITETAPVWSILGDIYRKLGQYGECINAYKVYLELNEDDEEVAETLSNVYEEAVQ